MRSAVIVDAVRTPIGKRNGILRDWHPIELMASVCTALVDRTGVEPAMIDDVIVGCVMQVGEQAGNVGRAAVLSAGWPESIPGVTIDRQCGSGQQAIHYAAQAVMSGVADVVIAGGVESMTRVPMGASMADGQYGYPFGPSVLQRYATEGGMVTQGVAAELVAEKWNLSRAELDEYAARSHSRAVAATEAGRFTSEILAVEGRCSRMVNTDEGVRPTDIDALAALPPAFVPDGRVTAGNSSQISDGAAAVLVMSEEMAREVGCRSDTRIGTMCVVGDDPRLMLAAAIPATHRLLERSGLGVNDVHFYEVNEAFASPVLAWMKELGVDDDRVNINGGSIALGHPLGCTGARLTATLVHELWRRGGGIGAQVVCQGGGMANALMVRSG